MHRLGVLARSPAGRESRPEDRFKEELSLASKPSLRVAVLMGGRSPEREISLASGICVAAALEEAGHRPRAIDPAAVDLAAVEWRAFDACFIALHGGAGEDGRVQRELEVLGVPYTGSGPAACRVAMSKTAAKECFLHRGIPTPAFVTLAADDNWHTLRALVAEIGFPLVIKPDGQGSSLGVQRADSITSLQRAVAESQFYDDQLLAEQYVAGREFTVAVLDREPMPLLEIVTGGQLFSYADKYHRETPAAFETGLAPRRMRELQQLAVETADALSTSGLVRVDLLLDKGDQPWVLELNTVPGMTERSLAPRACAEAGMSMPQLCGRLLQMCLQQVDR